MILNSSKKIALIISLIMSGVWIVQSNADDVAKNYRYQCAMPAALCFTTYVVGPGVFSGNIHPLIGLAALGVQAAFVYKAKEFACASYSLNGHDKAATEFLADTMYGATAVQLLCLIALSSM